MTQSQLLDEDHLLLSLGAPDANAHRAADAGQQYALIVVFSVAAARITAVFNNSRHRHCLWLMHPGCCQKSAALWLRHTC